MIECEFLVQENNFDSATERKLEQGTKEVVDGLTRRIQDAILSTADISRD